MRVLTLAVAALLLSACKQETPQSTPATVRAPAIVELVQTDVAVGEGASVAAGQTAVVHYTGWLYDPAAPQHRGTKFDSSRDKGQPFRFVVGAGRVIKGWDEGVAGMAVGGRRELVVPAHLGYGESGAGDVIAPGATLLFDVELLAIEPAN